jgi:acyl carrier protein
MKAAFAQATNRFGQIHGVTHAAGIAGGGIIQLKTPEAVKDIMAPKVKGTLVLDSLLSGVNLDFLFLCSSIDSLLGGVGQVDYCAANAFLDAYAQKHHPRRNVIAVNWCTWQEVGMAVDTEVPLDLKEKRERSLKFGILSDEGKEAFGRILNSSLPQVLVSTRDLSSVIEENRRTQGFGSVEKALEVSSGESMHPRPTLSSEYVIPGNPMEQTIADIWQELLKIEKVGIHDNFFELGGHSLLALQILARLKSRSSIQISAASLFENPTVHSLSEMILEGQSGKSSLEESKRRGQRRKERRLQRIMMSKEA